MKNQKEISILNSMFLLKRSQIKDKLILQINIVMSNRSQKQTPRKIQQNLKKPSQTVKNLTPQEKARKILLQVEEKLVGEIGKSSISIPTKPTPFKLENYLGLDTPKKQEIKKLQKMIEEKKQLKKYLTQVEKEEEKIKKNLELSDEKKKERSRKKLDFSPEDKKTLIRLRNEHIKFEKQLMQKTLAVEETQLKYKLEEKERSQKRIKEANQVKKEQIKQRLAQLAKKQSERRVNHAQQKNKLAKIKSQKKLHDSLAEMWQNQAKQYQEQKRKMYELRSKEKKITFQELQEHEKKYQQIIEKHRHQLTKKRLQASRVNNKLFRSRFNPSKFYTLIVDEEKQRKNEDMQKKLKIADFLERKKEYSQSVKVNFPPKVKERSQSEGDDEKVSPVRNALDPEQFRKKGLEYLEQSKNKRDKTKKKNDSLEQSMSKFEDSQSIVKYPDYLTQVRKHRRRKEGEQKSQKLQRNYDLDVEQARKIMKKTSITNNEKIERVKLVAQRLEAETSIKSSALLKKIQAKMLILQSLQ